MKVSSDKLPISIKEARKLLGKEFSKLPDDEIEDIVMLLDVIAHEAILVPVPK
jgi:hypothetical protein